MESKFRSGCIEELVAMGLLLVALETVVVGVIVLLHCTVNT